MSNALERAIEISDRLLSEEADEVPQEDRDFLRQLTLALRLIYKTKEIT